MTPRALRHLSLTLLISCIVFVSSGLPAAEDGPSVPAVTVAEPAAGETTTAQQEGPQEGGGQEEGETTVTETVVPGISLLKRFEQGGLTMYFLLLLSFGMVTFTLERLVHLRRGLIMPDGLTAKAKEAWSNDDYEGVKAVAAAKPSVLAAAITVLAEHRHLGVQEVSNLVGDEVSRMMRRHLGKAYPLAIVATLSPLLGLLGTVGGMIESFEVVAIAGSLGDASLLAGGISQALVTTAFGLIVSIPALGIYHYFRSRTNDFSLQVEEAIDGLICAWFLNEGAAPTTDQSAG